MNLVRPKPRFTAYADRDKIIARAERAHAQWIRNHACAVEGCPARRCQWAHVRCGLPPDASKGGMLYKPGPEWTVPLCYPHHLEQGEGEPTFNKAHNIVAKAEAFAKASPALKRMRAELEALG